MDFFVRLLHTSGPCAPILNSKSFSLAFSAQAASRAISFRNYWGLANLVNVNNAGMPEGLWDVTLNCRHVYHAPFQIPDIKRKYGNLTLTYAAQLHIAVIQADRATFQPTILAYAYMTTTGRT